jgi:methylglutamate dehydrogenase subunit B
MRKGRGLRPIYIDDEPMLIPCPHCGTRPVEEFTFLGDATVTRPTSLEPSSMDAWMDYVYLRDNPRGDYTEYVQHSGGCRAWLVVKRNTDTHEVHSAVAAKTMKAKS